MAGPSRTLWTTWSGYWVHKVDRNSRLSPNVFITLAAEGRRDRVMGMTERFVLRGARRRFRSRGIVDRYLVALEREERQRAAGVVDLTAGIGSSPERVALEPSFIRVAAEFSRQHGITYSTWVEAKVSAGVLESAGVTRSVNAAV